MDTNTQNLINSEQEMIDFGVEFGSNITKPKVIILEGDLGAGKTYFTKGLAKGLGIKDEVISPTFILGRFIKHSPFNLLHIDLYRLLETTSNIDILEEQLDELSVFERVQDSVIVIEWGTIVKPLFENAIDIFIKVLSETKREITISNF